MVTLDLSIAFDSHQMVKSMRPDLKMEHCGYGKQRSVKHTDYGKLIVMKKNKGMKSIKRIIVTKLLSRVKHICLVIG